MDAFIAGGTDAEIPPAHGNLAEFIDTSGAGPNELESGHSFPGGDEFAEYTYEGGALDVCDGGWGDDTEFWESFMDGGGEPPVEPRAAILVLGGMGWSDEEFDSAFKEPPSDSDREEPPADNSGGTLGSFIDGGMSDFIGAEESPAPENDGPDREFAAQSPPACDFYTAAGGGMSKIAQVRGSLIGPQWQQPHSKTATDRTKGTPGK
jgi:hypothetical protein